MQWVVSRPCGKQNIFYISLLNESFMFETDFIYYIIKYTILL